MRVNSLEALQICEKQAFVTFCLELKEDQKFDKIVSDREGKFDVRNMIVHLCSVSQLSGLG